MAAKRRLPVNKSPRQERVTKRAIKGDPTAPARVMLASDGKG